MGFWFPHGDRRDLDQGSESVIGITRVYYDITRSMGHPTVIGLGGHRIPGAGLCGVQLSWCLMKDRRLLSLASHPRTVDKDV